MEFDERRYRPLSTVDLFDEAFDLYKRNFVSFLLIVSVVVVPSTILTDIFAVKWLTTMGGQLGGIQFSSSDPTTVTALLVDSYKQSLIAIALYIPPWALVFSALTSAISANYLGKPTSIGQAYRDGIRRFVPAFIATVLFTAMLLSGSISVLFVAMAPDFAPLFLSVGLLVGALICLIVGSRYPLYLGAIVDEKLSALKGLKRSAALTSSDTGRVVWTILCMLGIITAISALLEEILEVVTGGIATSAYLTIPALANNKGLTGDVAAGLAFLLLTPFAVIVMTLLYYDQRVRKEGFDMEILAERLGYRPINAPVQATYSPVLNTPARKGKR